MFALALLLTPIDAPFGVLHSGLAIGPVGRGGRTPIQVDPVAFQLVTGTWTVPREGDEVGNRKWLQATSDKDGWFQGAAFAGGYAFFGVESPKRQIVLLGASGNSTVWINGTPRPGDPYSYGWSKLPIVLEKGTNQLLFSCRRGALRAEILPRLRETFLNTGDTTMADVVAGERNPVWCATVIVNATESPSRSMTLRAQAEGGEATLTKLPTLLPLQSRKVGFMVRPPHETKPGPLKVKLTLDDGTGKPDTATLELRVRGPMDTVKRTFISGIDGSVQYYAVRPATSPDAQALVLSLHGASVEASGQADAYSGKSWCNIVCPTNRRPFGFDWEEIGREDALEVLALAKRSLRPQSDQIYLSGHSMGGHGTWQLGVNYPNLFAAIGPSAGWSSFFSYGGGVRYSNPSPVEMILNRASNPSDTIALIRNLSTEGVYILHGDADDNVPVSEARKMADSLSSFHKDWQLFEQKGAGHWWENSDEPGAECMDWAPMYDMFARRRLPTTKQMRHVGFSTFNPGIASEMGWVRIWQQQKPLELSNLSIDCDPFLGRFTGTTVNVSLLRVDLSASPAQRPGRIEFNLDGQKLRVDWPKSGIVWLTNTFGKWVEAAPPKETEKNPTRNGGFKDVLRNRVVFVYGTRGSSEENAWAMNKARFDAEAFWYIGNGNPDVVADSDFVPSKFADRNVLLYGNSETNGAWPLLLKNCPVTITKKYVKVDEKAVTGEGVCAAFIYPREDSKVASVGVLGGVDLVGMRLCERLPIFTSGAGFPDILVIGPEELNLGTKGVRCAGFFGSDWRVNSGDFAWAGISE
jgi:pimeloyl-ACP methyl ester carboxylesterase